jgi:hypothetical protein
VEEAENLGSHGNVLVSSHECGARPETILMPEVE